MKRKLHSLCAPFAVAALLLPAGLRAADSPTQPAITPVKDQRALAELKRMSDALATAKSLSFFESSMSPVQGPNGQWLHILKTAKVELKRPNKLYVETGGDAHIQKIYFDGSRFAAASPTQKLYTEEKISGSVEDMLAEASRKSGYAFTFSDVLLADPFASWSKDLAGAIYVGKSQRAGETLHHLALTAADEDWEVWTDSKTHLPRMVMVKYLGKNRAPTMLIEFSRWNLHAGLPDARFAFKIPAGTARAQLKTPFAAPGGAQ